MARTNYSYEKRQREQLKKQKKEEKRQRKQQRERGTSDPSDQILDSQPPEEE